MGKWARGGRVDLGNEGTYGWKEDGCMGYAGWINERMSGWPVGGWADGWMSEWRVGWRKDRKN